MKTLAASTVVRDPDGRLLLVRRGHDPQAGRWTLPGGRLEPGETARQAATRETFEETGLVVLAGEELWVLDLEHGPDLVYEIHDFAAQVVDGSLRAGGDATDVGWFDHDQIHLLPLTEGLLGHLTRHGLL